jgi:hypothetical protein
MNEKQAQKIKQESPHANSVHQRNTWPLLWVRPSLTTLCFLGNVLHPYLTLSVCLSVTIIFHVFTGCASTLPAVTVSQIFVITVYTWLSVCTVQLINTRRQAGLRRDFVDYCTNVEQVRSKCIRLKNKLITTMLKEKL